MQSSVLHVLMVHISSHYGEIFSRPVIFRSDLWLFLYKKNLVETFIFFV